MNRREDEPTPKTEREEEVLDADYIQLTHFTKRKERMTSSMRVLVMIYVLMVLSISGVLSVLLFQVMIFLGILPAFLLSRTGMPFLVALMLIFFAILLSDYVSHKRIKRFDELIAAMKQVSKGDFSIRIDEHADDDSLRDLVHGFNEMADELSGIELFRKDFINNFSHEFKTPIVSIRGFAKQLERSDLTEEQRAEYVHIIVTESERLTNMSGNVLLLTKLENQQIVTDKEVYRLDEQLRSCILLLEKQWGEKDIELNLNLEEVEFNGNEEMMAHAWVNLINNAIKFSEPGGELELNCTATENTAIVEIRDYGEGMDEETERRLFEKFYQGDSAHSTEGNGLGLSLVKRIVDLCMGEIRVDTKKGEGTRFVIVLPNLKGEKHS